jgi:hypothetical protein
MKARRNPILALLALAAMTACGNPGAPMPPSAELPRAPQDLALTRKGNKVTLSWTPSSHTTDGQNVRLKKLGPALICRGVNEFPMAQCHIVGQSPPAMPPLPANGQKQAPPAPRVEYTDTLPTDLQQIYPTGFATYAVQAMNWRWRTAGLSNQVRVPLAPVLPPPPGVVDAKLTPDAIVVTFDCSGPIPPLPALSYYCRLYRKPSDGAATAIQDVVRGFGPCNPDAAGGENRCEVVDRTFAWETTYTYWVTPVTQVWQNGRKIAEVEGDDSPPKVVVAHDVFPPRVPAGLQAVASGVGQKPFVDLTWIPDTEADLAGYNVYRQEPDGVSWRKLNSGLATTSAFRDEPTPAGRTYTYAVSAVDLRGNESARSQPASERVP